MREIWNAQIGPIEYSSFNFTRQLLQSTSNPVDTAAFDGDWQNAVGICLAFIISGLTNSVGIGGGLFWVPLFNALLGFSVEAGAAMSQALIATGTLGGTMHNVLMLHPSTYSKPLIDYPFAVLLMPSLVLGVTIGVLLNIITPPLIVSSILFVALVLMGARTLNKGVQQRRKEKADALEEESSADAATREGSILKLSSSSFKRISQELTNIRHRPIIYWNYMIELTTIGGILLGFEIGKAQYDRCTWQYGVLFGAQVLLVAAVTIGSVVMHNKKKQKPSVPVNTEKQEERNVASVPSMVSETGTTPISPTIPTTTAGDNSSNNDSKRSNDGVEETKNDEDKGSKDWSVRLLIFIFLFVLLVGMFAGMVGLGGGILVGPLLVELGVHPQAAAATSTLVVFWSSMIAAVSFGLNGRINMNYFAVYGPVAFVGGLLGVFIFSGIVRKYKMNSLITLLLGVLVAISAGLVAGFAIREEVEDVINTGSLKAGADFCAD